MNDLESFDCASGIINQPREISIADFVQRAAREVDVMRQERDSARAHADDLEEKLEKLGDMVMIHAAARQTADEGQAYALALANEACAAKESAEIRAVRAETHCARILAEKDAETAKQKALATLEAACARKAEKQRDDVIEAANALLTEVLLLAGATLNSRALDEAAADLVAVIKGAKS